MNFLVNANEIIDQIKLLSQEEQQKVIVFIRTLKRTAPTGTVLKISENFKQVADEVFETNARLFKKLAK